MVLKNLETEYNIDLDLFEYDTYFILSRIELKKEDRNQGLGKEIMDKIIDYVDTTNKDIYLTPSKDFGATSIKRLTNFYKKFGFKKNKDYVTRESMVRYSK